MKNWINSIFWAFCRFCLGFRYRTSITGLEALGSLKGPTLVLPNHPAYVDPPLICSHIRLHKPLRPLVYSGTYNMLLLRPLMALVDAFEVADVSAHSRDAQARVLAMIDAVVERLHEGDCMLIYPSGRLQRGNREVVGAARAVHEIVSRCPEVNLVLVRTRGVWGSMFSCAERGVPPKLASRVWAAVGWVLCSLFFFLPRRAVSMHIEVLDRARIPGDSREEFNAFLESWYNADGDQQPQFVRYNYFFGPTEGNYGKAESASAYDLEQINPKTIRQVNDLLQSHLGRPLSDAELTPDTKLESIGLDSLDRMDLALKIEQQFGFRSNAVSSDLGGLWALADGQVDQGNARAFAVPPAWSKAQDRASRMAAGETPSVLADTLARAFLLRALTNLDQVAAVDATSGLLSYRRMLVAVQLMARRFSTYEERHVGLMLPASVASDIAFFALHLAGKIPVMMNWTTGPANLAHGVEVTEVRRIVTSTKNDRSLGDRG